MSNNKNQSDWDVDSYRKDSECEEHWELRRNFMLAHKDRFPEDKIVCLAQVFVNVEFLGCTYPEETMQLVAELSEDVAKDFRKQRSTRLQRTFVQASDAAEAKAKSKGRSNQNYAKPDHSHIEMIRLGPSSSSSCPPLKRSRYDLFSGLKFGNFVLYLNGGQECLRHSAQKCSQKYDEKGTAISPSHSKYEIFLNEKPIACCSAETMKLAKTKAIKAAFEHLRKECFSIKLNPNTDVIKIKKLNNKIVCDVSQIQPAEDKELDSSNIGYKMMKTMGWTGGGLGSMTQGRKDPVEYLLKNNRSGLSNSTCKLNYTHCQQVLNNYINSSDIRDLHFEPTFTKDERALVHKVAGQLGLKSHSYGKDESRILVISKRNITSEQIITEVVMNKTSNFCNKYFVQAPRRKMEQFPDHAHELPFDF